MNTSLPALEHVALIYKLTTVIVTDCKNQLQYIACFQSKLAYTSDSHGALSTACVSLARTSKKRPSVGHA